MKDNLTKILVFISLIVGLVLMFQSCTKESSSSTSSSSKIVGKWKWTFEEDDYLLYCILTFNKDGSGTYYENDGGKIDADNEPLLYVYDDKNSILTVMWIENGTVAYTDTCPVKWINDNKFVCDIIEDGGIFIKM